jgi:hypothetical protein
MTTRATLGFVLLAAACLAVAPAAGLAGPQADASDPDAKCLKCHSKGLKKTLEDGERMSLKVDAAHFEQSVHSVIGCTGCHRDITRIKHPKEKRAISSKRAYTVEQNLTCRQCHEAKYLAYQGSIHADRVGDGDLHAPVCSDCHSSHTVRSMAVYEPVSGQPCSNCHQAIYDAYAQSVHGTARADGNVIRPEHIQAPICADCHRAHEVNAVAAVEHLQTTCLDCHDDAAGAHDRWLPNAAMHMSAVSCAACHSPQAERRIDLMLYDNLAKVPVGRNGGHSDIQARLEEIDAGEDGLDPLELWKLVRLTNREGQTTDVTLRGRMEVTRGVDAHRLAPRADAVRSCESCHQGGAEAFQHVTVSIRRPDGRKQRFDAEKEVLSSAISVDTVGDFYAPGGTRVRLLDGLLAFAVLGALAVPVGHLAVGRILRRKKK